MQDIYVFHETDEGILCLEVE